MAAPSAIMLRAQVGLGGYIRPGRLAPVEVEVSNNGTDVSGTLLLTGRLDVDGGTGGGRVGTPQSYTKPVVIPHGADKHYTFYMPVPYATSGLSGAPLLFNPQLVLSFLVQGTVVASVSSAPSSVLSVERTPTADTGAARAGVASGTIGSVIVAPPTGFLIGTLSRRSTLLPRLAALSFTRQVVNATFLPLTSASFPDVPAVLANLDALIIEDFATLELSAAQRSGLESWVAAGGILIVVGGQHWQETSAGLPSSLLPVAIHDSIALPHLAGLTAFLRAYSTSLTPAPTAPAGTYLVSRGLVRSGHTLSSEQDIPLIVEGTSGQGRVLYLAVESEIEPLLNWTGTPTLWQTLLERVLFSRYLPPLPGAADPPFNLSNIGGALNNLPGMELGSPVLLLWILLLYVLVVGPLNYLVLQRLRHTSWGWYTIPGSIIAFSLLAYGLAFSANGNTVRLNSVSVVVLDSASPLKHVRSFFGLFVPRTATYTLHLPGQPHLLSTPPEKLVTVRQNTGSNDLILDQLQQWTMSTVAVEDELPVAGEISSDLKIVEGRLVGTITNTTNFSISDPKLIAGATAQSFPDLKPGQQQEVSLPLLPPSASEPLASPLTVLSNLYHVQEGFSTSSSAEQRAQALKGNLVGGVFTLINPALLDAYNGRDLNSGVLNFVGWTDRAPITGLVDGRVPAGAAATLLVAPLHLKSASPSALIWPVFAPSVISANTTTAPGLPTSVTPRKEDPIPQVIDEFDLPVTGTAAGITGLPPATTLTIGLSEQILQEAVQNGYSPPLLVESFNWRTRRWESVVVDMLKFQVEFTPAESGRYVSSQGILLVRLASKIAHGAGTLDLGRSIVLTVQQGAKS